MHVLCGIYDLQVLAKKFPQTNQLAVLVETLMDGLADVEALCSNGACVVLTSIAKQRGSELKDQVTSCAYHQWHSAMFECLAIQ